MKVCDSCQGAVPDALVKNVSVRGKDRPLCSLCRHYLYGGPADRKTNPGLWKVQIKLANLIRRLWCSLGVEASMQPVSSVPKDD